jgi:hypothetical protein
MLKKYLSSLTKEELIEEICSLSRRFKQVHEYYQARLEPNKTEDVLAAYKERVGREFFTRSGNPGPMRLGTARKSVQEFAKVQANVTHLIDLELFYVEEGVRFTNAFGDIDEPFYASMESMFERVLKRIKEHGMEKMFVDRAKKIANDTREIGWGFGDQIGYLYTEYFQ